MAEQSVERFEQSMLFDQYLGDVDLMRHPQYTEGLYEKDKELHDSILHSMGADLSYGYEFVESTYRTRICKSIRVGVRICFKERTDKWWQQNMMDISDIVRYVSENEGTIKAVGMRESLMEDRLHNLTILTLKNVCTFNWTFNNGYSNTFKEIFLNTLLKHL